MSRFIAEKKQNSDRVVAVAIENNKTSQYAAKWAVDTLLPKDQCLLLIHVRQKASSLPTPTGSHIPVDINDDVARAYAQQMDNETKELFDSFRIFCNRKNIKCKEIMLENPDISKALIESVAKFSIELLVLGAPSRSGLVRRFRTTDVPSTVSKGVPPFCTVYIIAKGKISSVRSATAPLKAPAKKNTVQPQPQPQPPQPQPQPHPLQCERLDFLMMRGTPPRSSFEKPTTLASHLQEEHDIVSPFTRLGRSSNNSYESSIPESDISFVSSGRPSVDRLFPSMYDDMDRGMNPRLSLVSDFDGRSYASSCKSIEQGDYSFSSQDSGTSMTSFSKLSNTDEIEAEMMRLKLELKQTMQMYSSACKEAMTAKQKAIELQRMKYDERKMEDVSQTLAEREQAKYKAAMEAAEASRKYAELEAQKKKNSEGKSWSGSEQNRARDPVAHLSARYRRYSIEEIETATKQFSNSVKIGEGGYGPVYRGELDCTQVAIKVLKADAAQGRSQFQQEVEVLSCIRHPNMVLLLGACPEYGCLVYEYMANGSLDDCLFGRGNSPVLPWQLRFRIAAEIATGLLFLHQTKPEPLVHRDLKPGNILLDRNFVSKISDVGLARLVPPTVADRVTQYRLTSTAGTFCYIDPEYQQTGMLGTKSDIYSLGIMLLQIVTAKPPMGLTHHVARAIENGTFAEMLDPAVEDWPVEHALIFAKIALQCAEMRRKDRPDLGKVVLRVLNELAAFAEDNMPMMMRFGMKAGFNNGNNYHQSNFSASSSESQNMSGMSGMSEFESHSSTSSSGGRP